MNSYQEDFINFLVDSGALTFGEFTTKSGRKTPYFINTGNFNDGQKISRLGEFYAAHMHAAGLSSANIIFGPAYKGIPLAISTCSALFRNHSLNLGYAFDRKEVKDHGDGGRIVGQKIKSGDKIVLVEDVITAGTTMRESIPMLRALGQVEILGVIIAADRCEKGTGQLSAAQEVEANLGVKVFPIVNIHQILNYLSKPENKSGVTLSSTQLEQCRNYLELYGVKS